MAIFDINVFDRHGTVELSTDEKAQVMEVLPKGINNDDTEAILTILSQIHAGNSSEEDISDQDQVIFYYIQTR